MIDKFVNEPLKRYDVFCEQDIDFYKLRNIGFFGNHRLYVNQDMGVIFKKIKGYRDDLYKIQYSYWK